MIGVEKFRHRNMIERFTGVEQSNVISILGMSAECEAEWLAAGHMPWRGGCRDQVSTVELVDLMLTYLLNLQGWPPEESRSVVGAAIAPVFYNAFLFADGSLEVTGLPNEIARFRESFLTSTDLANELTGGPHRFSMLCKVADSSVFRLATDAKSSGDSGNSEIQKAVCLRKVASDVVARLGRPLLSVELVNPASAVHENQKWLSSARLGKHVKD